MPAATSVVMTLQAAAGVAKLAGLLRFQPALPGGASSRARGERRRYSSRTDFAGAAHALSIACAPGDRALTGAGGNCRMARRTRAVCAASSCVADPARQQHWSRNENRDRPAAGTVYLARRFGDGASLCRRARATLAIIRCYLNLIGASAAVWLTRERAPNALALVPLLAGKPYRGPISQSWCSVLSLWKLSSDFPALDQAAFNSAAMAKALSRAACLWSGPRAMPSARMNSGMMPIKPNAVFR
jgi:hypothetical protein